MHTYYIFLSMYFFQHIKNTISNLPPGKLICTQSNNRYKWYISNPHQKTYLPKSQQKLAEQLAYKRLSFGNHATFKVWLPTHKFSRVPETDSSIFYPAKKRTIRLDEKSLLQKSIFFRWINSQKYFRKSSPFKIRSHNWYAFISKQNPIPIRMRFAIRRTYNLSWILQQSLL